MVRNIPVVALSLLMFSVGRGVVVLDLWYLRFLAWNICCLSRVDGYVHIYKAVLIQCYLYSTLLTLVRSCIIHTMFSFSPSSCVMVRRNMVSRVLFRR
jgi:hypothetical protein